MSKLFDYIQAYQARERAIPQPPLKMVELTQDTYDLRIGGGEATVYRIEARLGAQVAITDESRVAIEWEKLFKAKVYRPLAEEVFGEFRQPLLNADLAILQGDYVKASKLIGEVLDSMFRV